jgi:L-malate glycosyltransferase
MRITFLNPGHMVLPGGGLRIELEYANYLARKGHSVCLICPLPMNFIEQPPRARIKSAFEWWHARLSAAIRTRTGRSPLQWMILEPGVQLMFVPSLEARFIPDADVVFATWWQTAEAVADYPADKGVKFYLIQSYETWGGPKDRVDRTWMSPLYKVVISRWLLDLGAAMGAIGLRHIPNALSERFRVVCSPEDRPVSIVALYARAELKGAADALAVLERIHRRYPNLPMTMFGVGRRGLEIPSWIQYWQNPRQDDLINSIYNNSSIYLGASWAEGWSLPPAEAMACGCVFVGTDSGGVRDFAIDGETALLSPPKDREALYRNLCRVIEDGELLRRLQRNGTANIRQFTWEKSGGLLEQYLCDVIGNDRNDFSGQRVETLMS